MRKAIFLMSPWNPEQWISNNWRSPNLIVCLFIKTAYRITKLCRNIKLLDLRLTLRIGPPFYPKSMKIITQKENTISMQTSVSCISFSFLPFLFFFFFSFSWFVLWLLYYLWFAIVRLCWKFSLHVELGGPLACMQFRYEQSEGGWVESADLSLTWLPPWPS